MLSWAGAAISIVFVATKLLSRQTRVCRDKNVFVATKHVFCCDKSMLGATKMILVAAPANDSLLVITAMSDYYQRMGSFLHVELVAVRAT